MDTHKKIFDMKKITSPFTDRYECVRVIMNCNELYMDTSQLLWVFVIGYELTIRKENLCMWMGYKSLIDYSTNLTLKSVW